MTSPLYPGPTPIKAPSAWNMVRAGVVNHPQDWRWCGHDELVGRRRRHRLLDIDCVLRPEVVGHGGGRIPDAVRRRHRADDPRAPIDPGSGLAESIAVGGREFVERVCAGVQNRRRLEKRERPDGVWTVREAEVAYGAPNAKAATLDAVFEAKNRR